MLPDSEVLSSDSPFIIAYGVSHPWLLDDVPYVYLRDLPLRLSVTLLSGEGLRVGPIIKRQLHQTLIRERGRSSRVDEPNLLQSSQHPWSHVRWSLPILSEPKSSGVSVKGVEHQPWVFGPWLHLQHIQLPPLSANWQFLRGQDSELDWAGANVAFRQGVS